MTANIVRAAIHPGIGIARIGDSSEYVLAPAVTTPPPRLQRWTIIFREMMLAIYLDYDALPYGKQRQKVHALTWKWKR